MFMIMATEESTFKPMESIPDRDIIMKAYGPYTLNQAINVIEESFMWKSYVYIQELPEKGEIPEFGCNYLKITDNYTLSLYTIK